MLKWLRVIGLVFIVGVLAGCAGGVTVITIEVTATPAPEVSLADAQRVAADFLNAWMQDGYYAMYQLLTVNSRDVVTLDDFQALYQVTEKRMTLIQGGKSYSLANLIQQGLSADLAYDVTFQTDLFGEFTDPNRILHLAVTPEGWRVAWTPGDVIAEFKDGGSLSVTQNTPNRGNIYDHQGQALADQNGSVVVINLMTAKFPTDNPDACYAEISRLFPKRTAEQLKATYSRFVGRDFKFEVGQISVEGLQPERLSLEAVCTIEYDSHPSRRYMAGGVAPHVVGYVAPIPAEQVDSYVAKGYSPDALVGVDGIERYWESTLAGRGESTLNVYDGKNRLSRILAKREPQPSQSVYLTLDRHLQEATQEALRSAFTTALWGPYATGAAAVVMDVRTGEILAIASYPDFNVDAFNPNTAIPNAQELIQSWFNDPRKPLLNRAAQAELNPGSVFKIVSMAAAADSEAFGLNQRIFCGGVWNGTQFGDRTRNDWLTTGHGSVTLKQALTGSCNVYFWNIGWKMNSMDPYLLINYAKQMGFGAPTGIVGIAEQDGMLPDPATHEAQTGLKWTGSDSLNTVIGQGQVQATPLQVVRMVAAVANGGTLYQPLIVSRAGILDEYSYEAKPTPNGNINIKPEVLAAVRESMCAVTTNPTIGTAYFVYKDLTSVAVCGKTGTAEIRPGDRTTAWFAAFAGKTPDVPEIAVVAVVEKGGEGSYVASPIVRRIVETYFKLPITPWPVWWGAESVNATVPLGD
jgi:penicillin-binding protein 2